MPATDYLMPGGLEWDELAALLGPLAASPALAGLSLGCLNPEKDPDGPASRAPASLLAGAPAAPSDVLRINLLGHAPRHRRRSTTSRRCLGRQAS